ncbi:MAG: hypothetical protein HC830_08840 [Bacteroidetes bacterium]|nr:hypothetical protein [Bacteroidota bacterium]
MQLSTPALIGTQLWKVPVITMNDLYAGQKTQVIQPGTATGRLVIADADSLSFCGDVRNAILLIRGNSNDIPLCRGIITTCFQTPLSHISILSQNRKTPLVVIRDTEQLSYLQSLQSRHIRLSVTSDSFSVTPAAHIIDVAGEKQRIRTLPIDTITRQLQPLKSLRKIHAAAYGAKAHNLACLRRVRYKR